MYKSLFISPYKAESMSARGLALGLGVKMIRLDPEKSKFKGSKDKLVINWGTSGEFSNPEVNNCTVINPPDVLSKVVNKRTFFEVCSSPLDGKPQPSIPRWTTNKEEARNWIKDEKRVVFARTNLTGNSGEGIVEVETEQDLDQIRDGTLLVEYVPKRHEYRIHVCKGEVFDVQRKGRREGRLEEGTNWRVRNLKGGFVFVRNDIGEVPKQVYEEAVKACNKVGVDFGAVDIIFNERRNRAYVLEINSSPGLEGATLENYVNIFKKMFKEGVEDNGL